MLIEKNVPADILERNWDDLAIALNAVDAGKAPVFLAKLVLMLSSALEEPARLKQFIDIALQDIMPDQEQPQ